MNNRKLTNILLIILVVFNVAFVGHLLIAHWRMHHMHEGFSHFGEGEDRGMDFLVKELKLDSTQKKQLEILWKEHIVKMDKYQSEIMRFEKQTLSCMTQDVPDSTRAFVYADSAGMVRNTIHKELFRHFSRVKQLCNAEQKKKFDEIVKNMVMKFSHHWNGHDGEMKHDSM